MHRARATTKGVAAAVAFATLMPWPALAHGDGPPTLATAWSLSGWFLWPAAAMLALYVTGVARLWHRAGIAHGLSLAALAAFSTGALALFAATVWPLDAYGEWSLAAHMAQHMLLLAFVPPLLLAGQPLAVAAHALPRRWSALLHRALRRVHARAVAALAPACAAQLAVMGLWHLPMATAAALNHDGVHWLMHGSFLLAGFWFWAALWQRVRDSTAGVGPALVAIIAVMMQMGFIGALLTFSRRALYPVYAQRAPALGLEVLADQQLAGLIMWVPACVPYLVGGLWLMQQGLRRAERRQPTMRPDAGPPPDAR